MQEPLNTRSPSYRQHTDKVTVMSALPSHRRRPYMNGRDGDGVQVCQVRIKTSPKILLYGIGSPLSTSLFLRPENFINFTTDWGHIAQRRYSAPDAIPRHLSPAPPASASAFFLCQGQVRPVCDGVRPKLALRPSSPANCPGIHVICFDGSGVGCRNLCRHSAGKGG